jgi:Na+-transporting methylmalonyl-CoA/oxaloacetate decarboxylase gamma subunit
MPAITIVCGVLLVGVGAAGYLMQDAENRSATALIPAGVGIVLLLLGWLAYKDNVRKHAMHLAAALGLLGVLAGLGRLLPKAFKGELSMGLATVCILLMVLICAVFVGLCVNSFVQSRRRRSQSESGPE